MIPYHLQPDESYIVQAGMMIDGDGSPRCYAPLGSDLPALDYLANAGKPGDWYGLACDSEGVPYIQGQTAPAICEGFYVSTTALVHPGFAENDPAHYLDAEKERYVVVPKKFQRGVEGIVLGCKCSVTYRGVTVAAVVGDIGPDFGEGSIALAQVLGIPGSPKSGGVTAGVTYRFYPGIAAAGYSLQPA